MEAVASMVNALVDFFDEGEQSEVVLSAWRGFEIEQHCQFPELVPRHGGRRLCEDHERARPDLQTRDGRPQRAGRGTGVGLRRTGGVVLVCPAASCAVPRSTPLGRHCRACSAGIRALPVLRPALVNPRPCAVH
ncbi:hypothetical protein B0H14DRAFT_1628069 [Mycena olivaceomarginata]|nr:hypothetical protein B0H14DRAFT_1628069 [Mycena olivaceomarginata]